MAKTDNLPMKPCQCPFFPKKYEYVKQAGAYRFAGNSRPHGLCHLGQFQIQFRTKNFEGLCKRVVFKGHGLEGNCTFCRMGRFCGTSNASAASS